MPLVLIIILIIFSSKRTIGVGSIAVRQSVSVDRVRVNCGNCHRSILVSIIHVLSLFIYVSLLVACKCFCGKMSSL